MPCIFSRDGKGSEQILHVSCAAMFFVAMSYAFMYGTLPARLSAAFWSLKGGHGLPSFNSMGGSKVQQFLLF